MMSLASYILALVTATGGFASSHPVIGHPEATVQCLRFKQPLGYSASGAREQGDSIWYVLQLADGGTVTRPLFPKRERDQWTRGSRWTTKGDTVRIRVSDGLVGWDISLRPGRNGFTGVATYLTDVHVEGWAPPRLDVLAITIKCPAPPA
jgi:hypothetical protein